MSLFWLVYASGDDITVIIQPASHLIFASVQASMTHGLGTHQEGYALDKKTAKKVPKKMIGRVLSRKEAAALLKKLG
jgi:hypothetical protein